MIAPVSLSTAGRWLESRVELVLQAGQDDRGSALAEFAMSVPLLAFIMVASMSSMLIIQARFGVQAASREAGMVGAHVSTSLNAYDEAVGAAEAEAERVLQEYELSLDQATITFKGTDPNVARGSLFQVQVTYDVDLPTPSIWFINAAGAGSTSTFTVESVSVVPIQMHKARWPCPSPDPICS